MALSYGDIHTHTGTPAQSLYQVLCTSADLLGELDDVDSFEDDVICPHGIRTGERRATRQQLKH